MATQAATWGHLSLLDRQSVLVNEDGSKDCLNPELAAALLSQIDAGGNPLNSDLGLPRDARIASFVQEILIDIGVGSMEDLDAASLEELLQGILGG